jgi:hypothetical protein
VKHKPHRPHSDAKLIVTPKNVPTCALHPPPAPNFISSCRSQQPPKQPPEQNEESHLSGGLCNLLISMVFMAPEVGLEPTTLRLTAVESVYFPIATDCYESLPVIHLAPFSPFENCSLLGPIMTHFDRAWAQKWAQCPRSGKSTKQAVCSPPVNHYLA